MCAFQRYFAIMDEEESGFRYGGTKGGLCGCIAAILFVLPAGGLATLAVSLGDCFSNDPCHEDVFPALLLDWTVAAALAALLGFSVRALVNWWMQRRADPVSAGPPPIWALVPTVLLVPLALWAAAQFGA